MSWPDGERYLFPQQSLVVSLLLSLVSTLLFSLVSTLLFSRTGGILSHLNSSTLRFPRFPPRNLCFYVRLAVFSLVYPATDTVFCLSSYLSRKGRIENPSCSAFGHSSQDTSHLILHCPATDSLCPLLFGNFLSLQPLVQTLGSFPASGAPLSSAINQSLGITSHSATCYHKIPLLFIHTEHHYI